MASKPLIESLWAAGEQAEGCSGQELPAGFVGGASLDHARAFGGLLDLGKPSQSARSPAPARTPRGILVVGMGDENCGDGGMGIHLMGCLEQLCWPGDVAFCPADESVPKRAEQFAHVILLDSFEGPDGPGSLYQANLGELLAHCRKEEHEPLGMLGSLSPAVRKRLAVFAMHPKTSAWGAGLSGAVIASMTIVVPYLRAYILSVLGRLATVH